MGHTKTTADPVFMGRLRVSENGRYLVSAHDTPFFWLGDTAWELLHRLTLEETELYFRTRSRQGFNVIQAVLLAELNGLDEGNAYGRRPLLKNDNGVYDPRQPDLLPPSGKSYWDHIDEVVKMAARYGLYLALLPAWGDKICRAGGIGPEIFDAANARAYGRWLGNRYQEAEHIVWILGGDRDFKEEQHMAVISAMAEGLRQGGGVKRDAASWLCSFHPPGCRSSGDYFAQALWLDFHMIQSSHGSRSYPNYRLIAREYAQKPVRPVLDGEPCYEDIAVGFQPENGYFDAADVRKAAYWSVFSGACGHTYGHNSVWSMTAERDDRTITDWQTALERPGALQMQHLKWLMECYEFFRGQPSQEALTETYAGDNYTCAFAGGDYLLVYTPNGLAISLNQEFLGKKYGEKNSPRRIDCRWYDPRSGSFIPEQQSEVYSSGAIEARLKAGLRAETKINIDEKYPAKKLPPASGRGEDWVLVMEFGAVSE